MLKLIQTWIFNKYKAQLSIYDKGGSQHWPLTVQWPLMLQWKRASQNCWHGCWKLLFQSEHELEIPLI